MELFFSVPVRLARGFLRHLRWLSAIALPLWAICQSAPPASSVAPVPEESPRSASISGVVSNIRDGKPLKRASVSLKPLNDRLPALSDTTDEKGRFAFPGVPSGRYSIQAARDGFLSSSTGWLEGYRFPPSFVLRPGVNLSGLAFRLYPWGVISGRIRFDDADPVVGADVILYRDAYWHGRHVYETASRGRTDDRGEYRLHGLDPGSYIVSASWDGPVLTPGAEAEPRRDEQGNSLPDETYAVTFYPSAQKLLEAVPVRLGYGDEASAIDIFLSTARTVRIHGRVTSGLSGVPIASPSITVRRAGSNDDAGVAAPATVNLDKKGNYDILGLTPGPYYVMAESDEADRRLIARRLVNVTDKNIAELELLAVPSQKWRGQVRVDGAWRGDLTRSRVVFDPRDDSASPSYGQIREDGAFSLDFFSDVLYDVYIENPPAGTYLKSANSAGLDLLAYGASAPPETSPAPMDIVLDSSGGRVIGVVVNDDRTAAPGVDVDLIPDPPQGRYQTFQHTNADEFGNFRLSGVAPGNYLMIAWSGEAPCDIYDPHDQGPCRAAGASVAVHEDAEEPVTLKLATPIP